METCINALLEPIARLEVSLKPLVAPTVPKASTVLVVKTDPMASVHPATTAKPIVNTHVKRPAPAANFNHFLERKPLLIVKSAQLVIFVKKELIGQLNVHSGLTGATATHQSTTN